MVTTLTKRAKGNNRLNRRPRTNVTNVAQFEEEVCSNFDPFCEHALNAKLFDRDSSRSTTFQERRILTMPATAGELVVEINANLFQSLRSASSIVGGTVATWNAYATSPAYTELSGNYTKYRIVSWGFKLRNTYAPLSTQGLVSIATTGFIDATPSLGDANMEEYFTCPAYNSELNYVGKVQDISAFDYHAMDQAVGNGWNHAYVMLAAGATTQTIMVDITWNLELIVEPGNFTSRMASRPAPHVPLIEAAISNARSMISSVIPGSSEEVEKYLKAKARLALRGAVAYASNAIMGPMGPVITGMLTDPPRRLRLLN